MIGRRVLAVAAGLGANFLAIPIDLIFHAVGVFPPFGQDMSDGLYLVALAYRTACAVLGGWLTARLAPDRPLGHAGFLGGLGVVLSSLGAVAQWDLGHHYYPIALIIISLPATLTGAWLHRSRS